MFDIPCPQCGEPWDHDELHRVAEEVGLDHEQYDVVFQRVRVDFRKRGCELFDATHNIKPSFMDVGRAEATAALMDIMPDDFDGVAAMLGDAGWS